MNKLILAVILGVVLCSPAGAVDWQKYTLPYTPVPRNPDSKQYQPFYGYESDRRIQKDTPRSYQHDQECSPSYGRERGRGNSYGSRRNSR